MGAGLEQYLVRSANDPSVIVTALAVAFFLGAAHALTPGHGKTIVAAYLAGSRGRIADAIYLGAVVTITHTASVFVLGFATLYATQTVAPERVFPWLSLISAALVTGIGLWLVRERAFPRAAGDGQEPGRHHHHGHSHGHNHGHAHSHGFDGAGRGGLLSLGISGGLVPCPEAMVVLMMSVSIRQVALGIGLLAAFSLGLAAVLMAIGIAMVLAGSAIRKAAEEAAWIKRLPVVSAVVVAVLGMVMLVQAVLAFSNPVVTFLDYSGVQVEAARPVRGYPEMSWPSGRRIIRSPSTTLARASSRALKTSLGVR